MVDFNLGFTELTVGQSGKETTVNTALGIVTASANETLVVDLTSADVDLSDTQFTTNTYFNCTGHTVARTLGIALDVGGGANTCQRKFIVKNGGTAAITVDSPDAGFVSGVILDPGVTALLHSNGTVISVLLSNGNAFQVTDWKESVRVATTANGVLATAYENADTVDGVVLATGDRILLKDQTTGAENGIYTVNATGAPTRATDFVDPLVSGGAVIVVEEGTANADTLWGVTNNGAVDVGTDAITFAELGGAGGSTTFLALTDTPSSYTSQEGKAPRVNSTPDGLEFFDPADLAAANTFTAGQTITGSTAFFTPMNMISTEAGVGAGPLFVFDRDSASPAANDLIGGMFFRGKSSTGVQRDYGAVSCQIIDPTNAAEDGNVRILTIIAGVSTQEASWAGGMILGSPTGSYKGLGTLNAVSVYDDDVILTDIAFEAIETGAIDTDKWDATVPDLHAKEERIRVPVTEEVPVTRLELQPDGSYVAVQGVTQREKKALVPIYDKTGNGIDAVEEAMFDEIIVPAKTIPRKHYAAHMVKAMLAEGFDPKDPRSYIDKMRRDRSLPCMPDEAEWEHGKYSLGEMTTRKWIAMEFLAIAFASLVERVEALEEAR